MYLRFKQGFKRYTFNISVTFLYRAMDISLFILIGAYLVSPKQAPGGVTKVATEWQDLFIKAFGS